MAGNTVKGHTAFIHDRGGMKRLFEIKNMSQVQWGRNRDAISVANIELSMDAAKAQADTLNQIEPGRHELVLFRGGDRVWEGPVNSPSFTKAQMTMSANDVFYYAHRTAMQAQYSNAHGSTLGIQPVVQRAVNIMTAELARKEALDPPVNILPFLTAHIFTGDVATSRKTLPYASDVWSEIDYMAANLGMDYTVVGRQIVFWDVHDDVIGHTPVVTEADFLGDPTWTGYGSELGTRAIVTDGQGHHGEFGGVDPYYGEWDRVTNPYAEDSGGTTDTIAALTSQAQRDLGGRNPTPWVLRIPDGSAINTNGALTVDLLVPGIYIPLRGTFGIREVQQMQKLDSMQVTEDSTGEVVTVTLSPATGVVPDSDDEG